MNAKKTKGGVGGKWRLAVDKEDFGE